ncbi:MAG TPA: PIN domain-containing protein [Candidatus Limnocylindria bacterium]
MRRIVADAGVVLGWFEPDGEHRALRAEYEAGALTVIAPESLVSDAMARLVRRGGWTDDRLAAVAGELSRLGFQLQTPPLQDLAHWMAKGLSPSGAACAALAARLEVPLVTDDADLRRAASGLLQR